MYSEEKKCTQYHSLQKQTIFNAMFWSSDFDLYY